MAWRAHAAGLCLAVAVSSGADTSAARLRGDVSFESSLERQGVRFRVTSRGRGSLRTLRIAASVTGGEAASVERAIGGAVSGAETGDLDADGEPEIYVYVTSAGSGSYGSLAAYAVNRDGSLDPIHLPPLAPGEAAAHGYMGHDEFAVVDDVLVRRFPVYREGDTNARPGGGTRVLRYRLVPGEGDRLLDLVSMIHY